MNTQDNQIIISHEDIVRLAKEQAKQQEAEMYFDYKEFVRKRMENIRNNFGSLRPEDQDSFIQAQDSLDRFGYLPKNLIDINSFGYNFGEEAIPNLFKRM
jgi:hypothetical protein